MGIAIFSPHFSRFPPLTALRAPIQALVALFMPAQSASAIASRRAKQAMLCHTTGTSLRLNGGQTELTGGPITAKQSSMSRLKIVREFEPGIAPSAAGRMVISGRMADVCAELDRMAQGELIDRQI